MGFGGTLRRFRADPIVGIGTLMTVMLALVLLAAGPIYSDAVAVGALRRSLIDAPAATTAVAVGTAAGVDEASEVADIARRAMQDAFGPVAYDDYPSLVAGTSFELPDQPTEGRVDLTQIAWLDRLDDHIVITEGRSPTAGNEPIVEVLMHREAASEVGLASGAQLEVSPRSRTGDTVEVHIVGTFEVLEPSAAYWAGRPRLSEPVMVSPAFRTVTMFTTRASLLASVAVRPDVELLAVPRFDRIELDEVDPLRRGISGLERSANEELDRLGSDSVGRFEVVSSAASVLSGSNRTLTVARAVVIAVVLQLSMLAAFALLLIAGLGVEARRAESAMLRARGASATHLLGQAVLDAVLVVAPVALVAPFVAVWLVGAFDNAGPLASIDLRLDPKPVAAAWLTVAIAALVTVCLLAWPALRAARSADADSERATRPRLAGWARRSGLDVVVLLAAAGVYWQLRTLGDERATTIRGRFGVDPLLIAAPTLGLVAGAFLALRVVPAAARLIERLVARTTSAATALAGWQFARRPHRYARASLLVIMATAIGTFAATYERTFTQSQGEQAAHSLAADGRMAPNVRTGDSLTALHLTNTIHDVDGVRAAMPVVVGDAVLPAADRPAKFVALDASSVDVLNSQSQRRDGLLDGVRLLNDRRLGAEGLQLPGRPASIDLTIEAPLPPEPEEAPNDAEADDETASAGAPPQSPPPPFVAGITMLLRDGDGILHRVAAGALAPGRSELRVDLVAGMPPSAGDPRFPLSLMAIEFASAAQRIPSRDIEVTIAPLTVHDLDGGAQEFSFVETELTLATETVGFLDQRADLQYGTDAPNGGLSLVITTGRSFNAVPVFSSVRARTASTSDILPALATQSWLRSSGTNIGDLVPVSFGRSDDVRVEIVAHVDAVPTIDPVVNEALIVDYASLMWLEQTPGNALRSPSAYWFSVDDDREPATEAFTSAPIEAVSVTFLTDEVDALTASPSALASIGAFGLGFAAAAAFAVAGFVVTITVSARERRAEFAVLHALGLDARQRRRWMMIEQAVLVVVGSAIGLALGVGLSGLILPVVSLTQDGSSVFPDVAVVVPWSTVFVLIAAVMVGMLLGTAVLSLIRDRGAAAAAIRAGGDA